MAAPFLFPGLAGPRGRQEARKYADPEVIGNMGTKSKSFIPWELATMNRSNPNKIKESHNFLVLSKEVSGRRRRSQPAPFAVWRLNDPIAHRFFS